MDTQSIFHTLPGVCTQILSWHCRQFILTQIAAFARIAKTSAEAIIDGYLSRHGSQSGEPKRRPERFTTVPNNITRSVSFALIAALLIGTLLAGAAIGAVYIQAGVSYLDNVKMHAAQSGTPLK
jgi:hypothetical protein